MTGALKIRQKFINLMYLVFILFAFIYAPTTALDSLFFSTRSMKRATDILMGQHKILKESVKADGSFIAQNKPMYYSIMSINDSVESIINRLDSFQYVLSEPKEKGLAGYPPNYKSSHMANKTFLYSGAGEELRLSVERIKTSLKKAGFDSIKSRIDSLIPTSPIILNSKGADRDWSAFFFAKAPKAIMLLTTEKIKGDLLNMSNDLFSQFLSLKSPSKSPKSLVPADNTMFVVTLASGEEVPIKLDWSALTNEEQRNKLFADVLNHKLNGTLKRDGNVISYATFNQRPMNPPPAPQPAKEDPMYAFIGDGAYEEMYLGVDNPIGIAFSAPLGYSEDVTVSDGAVIMKGDKYFLRFKKEGYVKVSVFAVKGGDRRLLQEKNLKVVLIPDPDVYLSGYRGGVISKDIVKVAKNIDIKSNAYNLPSDAYNCESFDVTLIPFDNPIGEIKSKGNSGRTFSDDSKEILKNVKRGDVIVLDNFRVKTVEGIIRRIPAVVYRVI